MNLRSERQLKLKMAVVSQKKTLLGFIVYIHAVCCSLDCRILCTMCAKCIQESLQSAGGAGRRCVEGLPSFQQDLVTAEADCRGWTALLVGT